MADPYNVSALASTSDGLSVTLPTLTPLSLKPTADGTFSQQDIAVTISASDYINTYSLDMYTYDPSTTKSTTSLVGSGTNIPTIQSSSTGSFSTNGWAYSIDSGSNYQPITTANMPIASNKPANATNTSKVTFGVRVDNTIPNGLYSATLNFVATATVKSYDIIYGTTTGISSVTLDGQACTAAISAGGCKKTLPYGETYTLTATAATGYTFSTWSKGSSDPGTLSNPTSTTATTFTIGAGPATLTPSATINKYTCTKQYRLQNADGTWGNYQSDGTQQVNYNATCSYSKSVTDYKNSANGTNGAQASTSGTMGTSGLTLSLDFYRNTYTLTVSAGDKISSASFTSTAVHGTNYFRWGQAVNITATASTNNKFKEWTTSSGGSFGSSTTATTTYTMPKANATITANGEANGLQGITSASCPNSATSITDSRDGQSYKIAKLADGKCWMLDNLRLSGSRTLTSADTNLPSGVTFELPASSTGFNSYTTAQINSNTMNNSVNSGGVTGNLSGNGTDSDKDAKFGAYYNYCAASAGGICTDSNSSNNSADRDICPKGWKLPTKAEYDNLLGKYSAVADFTSAFKLPFSGYAYGTSVGDQGRYGYFWSSTYNDSTEMYYLVVGSSYKDTLNINRRQGISVRCMLK